MTLATSLTALRAAARARLARDLGDSPTAKASTILTPTVRETHRAGTPRCNFTAIISQPAAGGQPTASHPPVDAEARGDESVPPTDTRSELKALIDEFFQAVSFEKGERPTYARIRDLFLDDGKLIMNSFQVPEISSVDDFIVSRQRMVDSGTLTSFREVETAETTEVFGNVAHRLSTYEKSGTRHQSTIAGSGVISTQFIRTPSGWQMSSMAWDDVRPGLAIPDRYR